MMPDPNPNSELSFNQYAVLLATINNLREELRATTAQMNRLMEDHEERLRRNEVLIIIGFGVIILTGIVTFFVVREMLLRG